MSLHSYTLPHFCIGLTNLRSTYTRETIQEDHASNGENIYHCSSSSSSSATQTSTVAVAPSSSSSSTAQPTSTSPAGTTSASPTPTTSDSSSAVSSHQESATPSTTVTHSSSIIRTLESQTTINGTATSVPFVTTVVTAVPATVSSGNGSAVGLGTTGGEHKSNTAAIAGGVVGGVAGLLLFGILGAWYARTQRKAGPPAGPTLITDASVVGPPSDGPTSPNMAERNIITPFLAGAPSGPFNVPQTYLPSLF